MKPTALGLSHPFFFPLLFLPSSYLEHGCNARPRHRRKHPRFLYIPLFGKMGENVRGYEQNGKIALDTKLHMRPQHEYSIMSPSKKHEGNIRGPIFTQRNDRLSLHSQSRVCWGPKRRVIGPMS